MPIPPFRSFGPSEAMKQLSQLVNQPMLTNALREAAQKLGIREVPSLSSLQELLRQAGRWIDVATEPWAENQGKLLVPGINATGECFSGRWTASKLSPDAMAILNLIHTTTTDDSDVEGHCRTAICGATGAADALVAPNLALAIHVAVQGLYASGRIERVVLPRKCSVRIPAGPSHGGSMLPEMLEACGLPVREIGSNRECLDSDFDRCLDAAKQLLLLTTCGTRDASYQSGIARAHESHCIVAEVAFDASLHDLMELGIASSALSRRWDHGPDLIIAPGQYLLGGPECGVLLGKKDIIQTIRKWAEGTGMLASRPTHLLLADAISHAQSREGWNATPIGAMLNNSLANLENRAKRIVAQCDIPDAMVKVECCTQACKLGNGVWQEVVLESAVLRATPKEGITTSRIAEKLAQHTPAIWGNILSDRVELVLRTVDPAEDSVIVSALCGLTSEREAPSETNDAE
jgi:L-seryl-tRNA(Ser) seleniumtransferase